MVRVNLWVLHQKPILNPFITHTHKPMGLPIKSNPIASKQAQKHQNWPSIEGVIGDFNRCYKISYNSLSCCPKIMFFKLIQRLTGRAVLTHTQLIPITCVDFLNPCHCLVRKADYKLSWAQEADTSLKKWVLQTFVVSKKKHYKLF